MARDTRWYGALGIYGQSGDLIATEAQYNFATLKKFNFWVSNFGPAKVYNDSGYVIGFGTAPNGNTDVEVYRICIGGKPVTSLPGSKDLSVRVTHSPPSKQEALVARYGCSVATYDPNKDFVDGHYVVPPAQQ